MSANYTDAEKLLSALFAPRKSDDPTFDRSTCQHDRTEADNYGESCYDCRAQLRGYGYGGWFGKYLDGAIIDCIHQWYKVDDDYEQCVFCERTKLCDENKL
jgi:hypothetical protein